MSAGETEYLVCYRVEDLPAPRASSVRDKCGKCNEPVWQAKSSPMKKVVCIQCAAEMMRGRNDVEIIPPTENQVDDIAGVQ